MISLVISSTTDSLVSYEKQEVRPIREHPFMMEYVLLIFLVFSVADVILVLFILIMWIVSIVSYISVDCPFLIVLSIFSNVYFHV